LIEDEGFGTDGEGDFHGDISGRLSCCVEDFGSLRGGNAGDGEILRGGMSWNAGNYGLIDSLWRQTPIS
jgi:hypothetical protein